MKQEQQVKDQEDHIKNIQKKELPPEPPIRWAKGYGPDSFEIDLDAEVERINAESAELERRRNLKPTYVKSVSYDFKPPRNSNGYYDTNTLNNEDWNSNYSNKSETYGTTYPGEDIEDFKGESLNSTGYSDTIGEQCWEEQNPGVLPIDGDICSNEVGTFEYFNNRWNIMNTLKKKIKRTNVK